MKLDLRIYSNDHLTVCVTGAGAGRDSAREQRKLEARKMLENAAESPASSARFVRSVLIGKVYAFPRPRGRKCFCASGIGFFVCQSHLSKIEFLHSREFNFSVS